MKRFAVVCALVLCVLGSGMTFAAESADPDGRLDVNPIPTDPVEPIEDTEFDPITAIGGYIWARVRDVGDIVTLKLGWGTHRSIGVQVRATRLVQVGAGCFEGWVVAMDRGCVGVMKEAEIEAGLSLWYVSYIARDVIWETEDAKRRNVFFGDVGDEKELTPDDLNLYDDENAHPLTLGVQAQLPCLPKIEAGVNLGEIPDLLLGFFHISGFRVPPPFHMQDGPNGERIPAPSIFWHGQEKYEKYE